MGIGVKFEVPFLGTVKAQHVPNVDGTKNADNAASGSTDANGSGNELVVITPLGGLPVVGDVLDGLTLTLGYAEDEVSTVANTSDRFEYTGALTGSYETLNLVTKEKLLMKVKLQQQLMLISTK